MKKLIYDLLISKYVSSAALSAPTLSRILSGLTREEIRTNLPTSRIEVDHKAISGMGKKGGGQPT
ncbi:hypothetical protein A4A49_59662 [Nicotiana attenuata]|uniref:Uncharacterized protein n=1 Tax=Nicotiana attenuata TaxID=49451 RepID=A0A314KQU3_NICAT|nr:hypothetical protein A4A49_59662 [Nicotiana attenuata]